MIGNIYREEDSPLSNRERQILERLLKKYPNATIEVIAGEYQQECRRVMCPNCREGMMLEAGKRYNPGLGKDVRLSECEKCKFIKEQIL